MRTKIVCVVFCVLMITSLVVITFPKGDDVSAMVPNFDPVEQSLIGSEPAPPTRELTIIFGTDNNDHPGQGLGRLYHYSSGSFNRYTSYFDNVFYNYKNEYSSSSYFYEYRGWAVFDLSDLAQFEGVSISSGSIVYRQDYQNHVTNLNFQTLNSVPYGYVYDNQAQEWFNEAGGSGTINLGSVQFSGTYDSENQNISMPISVDGLSWLNNKIDAVDYDIPIGSYCDFDYYSAYLRGGDVRLVLTLTYDELISLSPYPHI